MKTWRLAPLAAGIALAIAGQAATAGTATVYYYKPYKNWGTAYIHHNASGSWTNVPGEGLTLACTNWYSKAVTTGTATTFQAVFTNGSGAWDNLNNTSGSNYTIPNSGIHQVKNGQIVTNTTSPCAAADTAAPTAPTALTKGTVSSGSVALSWAAATDNVGVTGYLIFRNGVQIGTSTSTSYTDTGVSGSTTYSYTVKARDAANNQSLASAALSVTTPAASTYKATVYYYTKTRAWSAAYIHYAPSGGSWTAAPGAAMNETACTDWKKKTVDLGAVTSMKAAFNNGSGAWDNNNGADYTLNAGVSTVKDGVLTSNAAAPCVSDSTAPSVPSGLTKGTVTSTSAAFTWTASTDTGGSGLAGYRVYRNGTQIATTTSASYTATGLTAATAYTFTVAAYDQANNVSAQSAALSITTTAPDTTPPSAPTGLSKGTVAYNAVPLSWVAASDNVGVTGYDILRNGTKVGSSTGTSYTDNGVAASTSYSYTVKAKDAAGNVSAASAALSITTPSGPVVQPGTPIGTDMREESIYFVMTARFFDGDSTNNRGGSQHVKSGNAANNDPMFRGDFKGLIQKLDYIKALGFSAVWITPVVLNRSDYDFHGYHGYDFMRVDPRLESPGASYQDLINAAHAKGIKIIQDVVYNHSSRWGEKNLFAPKVFGIRDSQWSWYYDEPDATKSYDGLTSNAAGKPYNGDLWSTAEPAGNTCRNWGQATGGYSAEGYKLYNCQWPTPTSGMFPSQYFHQCWIGNWEGEDSRSCWIHEDLADFNTESKPVQDFLKAVYRKYIDMGVDGFRIDTAVHIPRVTWNRHFLPDAKNYAVQKFGTKGQNFFMFGEVGSFVNDKWNRGSPNHSAQFFTWKERKEYSADDTAAALEQYNYEQSMGTANQPTSSNAFLQGNSYHAPDHSKFSGMSVIDMRMHMNFGDANNAFWNGKDSDDSYNDATMNVVYVDSHDYGPNKSNTRYAGGTAAWAENMSLMWTFRGIPTLYYGSEIEFQAGKPIDCGPTCPLATTGRAYFGDKIDGTVTVSDFGVVSGASGNVATTLSYPLVKHVQRLNQIRRKIPALQKGQYSTEGVSGGMAYKRRYTAAGVDSFALVTVSGGATFSGIPNGTYKDAVTGDVKTVTGGTLTASVSGQGNARIYVLDTAATPAPGKIGVDGPYLKP